jgi:tRNA-guanine transglycosylase
MERTHRWTERFLRVFEGKQGIFGIVQGGEYKELREMSAKFVSEKPFDGFGIGGSLGKSKRDMLNIIDWVIPILPEEKPRHLLGIGGIEDIFNCIERGIDMFDCVTPTRWARRGMLFVSPESGGTPQNKFMLKIRSTSFVRDNKPLDTWCDCFVCKEHTKAYLRHLYKSERLNFWIIASYHNVHFIVQLMRKIREAIKNGEFSELKREWIGR